MTLIVENVEMTFQSRINDLVLHSKVKGGKEQDLQNELDDLQYPYKMAYAGALDSLQNKKYTSEQEFRRLNTKYQRLQPLAHKVYVDFGRSHANSYLGLDIIYRNRGRIGKDTLKTIYKNLDAELKQSSNAVALQVFLYEEYAEVGKRFIDFRAKDLEGNDFTLSSLEGKYIYLNFWSSGCEPCRMENKVISKNYNKIPDKLAIVNFSLDKNASAWDKASKADSIIWHNVSDLEGGKGRVKTIYGVQAMPTSFLIDENGIIVKRFYGFDTSGRIIDDLIKIIEEKV
ncbi:TlpA disulfide reductase family protein [Reichenbachiella sp. MALMAid0571]|uniref:TlpA family protein disulfide reductase n=1 Tax=Reichenbachiella sp. MALMAid0571 TaxID=3143939 RepID=UPI0032DFCFCF